MAAICSTSSGRLILLLQHGRTTTEKRGAKKVRVEAEHQVVGDSARATAWYRRDNGVWRGKESANRCGLDG